MYINRQLGLYYQEINRSLALSHYQEQFRLARMLRQSLWEAEAMSRIGHVKSLQQNYSGSLNWLLKAEDLASDPNTEKHIWNAKLFTSNGDPHLSRLTVVASIFNHIGILYYFVNNKTTTANGREALRYLNKAVQVNELLNDKALISMVYANMGSVYRDINKLDSGKWALLKGLQYCLESGHTRYEAIIHYDLGGIFESESDFNRAKREYDSCVRSGIETESYDFVGLGYLALANVALKTDELDSALTLSKRGHAIYVSMKDTLGLINSCQTLTVVFDKLKLTDSAYFYLKKGNELSSAMNIIEKLEKFQVIGFEEQIRLQALEAEQLQTQSRIRIGSLAAGISVLILVSIILFRTNKRQKSDKHKIETAYDKLKSTQSQLIQSEKMASLGELTAGIAHEIQNPLNFVNNFSELNAELVNELEAAVETGDLEEVKSLVKDIKENEEKIGHHGKRADGIVKSMLQHSRTSSGQSEMTDINTLCEEYLRLAYHGYLAKDKSFNAKFETDFDTSLPKINVVPQDIGRVILNLINNAFYAVNEKEKLKTSGYEPRISVSTKNLGDKIEIKVKDNGNGIPESVKEKIFQPFFTTKPAGQGTGLGLSLAYDIITKGHSGELKVETKEGKETTFVIQLPKN